MARPPDRGLGLGAPGDPRWGDYDHPHFPAQMPFATRELLRWSLEQLHRDYSPLLTVSLPCMLSNHVPTCNSIEEAERLSVRFGAAEEREWLDQGFRVNGGPEGKPYFMPGTSEWVQGRYADRSLQRRRKDFDGKAFYHPDTSRWAIRTDAPAVLASEVLGAKPRIPTLALFAWIYRDREVESLERGLAEFERRLGLSGGGFDSLYERGVTAEWRNATLRSEPVPPDEIAELTGAAPPPPVNLDPDELAATLVAELEQRDFVGASLLVDRIVNGWLVGEIVVLVGPTGSGKTFLARLLGDVLAAEIGEDRFSRAFFEITPDHDSSQFFGYESLSGAFSPGQFAREVLLAGQQTDPRLVVLDEWNLAAIDGYFAPVLSAVESGQPGFFPGQVQMNALTSEEQEAWKAAQPSIVEGRWELPHDTFFLATCNSWTEEPESRKPISGPVKRRCRIIHVQNYLKVAFDRDGDDAIIDACDRLLNQEVRSVRERIASGTPSILDRHRARRLEEVGRFNDLDSAVREKIIGVVRALLRNEHAASRMTMGILRDVLLAVAYASPARAAATLGRQVADKVIHQLRGDPTAAQVLCTICDDLENAPEIRSLAERMRAFSGDLTLRPLL